MKEMLLGWKLFPLAVVSAGVFAAAGSGVATLISEAPIVSDAPVPEMLGLGKTVAGVLGVVVTIVGLGLHYQDKNADRTTKAARERDKSFAGVLTKFAESSEVTAKENRESVRRLHQKTELKHEESVKRHDELVSKVVGGLSDLRTTIDRWLSVSGRER